jgi:hypothetical protein
MGTLRVSWPGDFMGIRDDGEASCEADWAQPTLPIASAIGKESKRELTASRPPALE